MEGLPFAKPVAGRVRVDAIGRSHKKYPAFALSSSPGLTDRSALLLRPIQDSGTDPGLLRQALVIEPRRPNAYKNLGLALEAKGEFAQAAEQFIAATHVNATDSRSLGHLEALMAAHPELEVDVPDLRERFEACVKVVEVAMMQQPDYAALWARRRQDQEREA